MIGVIDYGRGNLRSVAGAIRYLGSDAVVTRDPAQLKDCDRAVLPGVGAFGEGMQTLAESGWPEALADFAMGRARPFLGICLGAQLLARDSHELGRFAGLGWFDASVVRLEPSDPSFLIPHVGWNEIRGVRNSVLLHGISSGSLVYFNHSFHVRFATGAESAATMLAEHGMEFVAAFERETIFGVQFHPEKSQKVGLQILKNFIEKT